MAGLSLLADWQRLPLQFTHHIRLVAGFLHVIYKGWPSFSSLVPAFSGWQIPEIYDWLNNINDASVGNDSNSWLWKQRPPTAIPSDSQQLAELATRVTFWTNRRGGVASTQPCLVGPVVPLGPVGGPDEHNGWPGMQLAPLDSWSLAPLRGAATSFSWRLLAGSAFALNIIWFVKANRKETSSSKRWSWSALFQGIGLSKPLGNDARHDSGELRTKPENNSVNDCFSKIMNSDPAPFYFHDMKNKRQYKEICTLPATKSNQTNLKQNKRNKYTFVKRRGGEKGGGGWGKGRQRMERKQTQEKPLIPYRCQNVRLKDHYAFSFKYSLSTCNK